MATASPQSLADALSSEVGPGEVGGRLFERSEFRPPPGSISSARDSEGARQRVPFFFGYFLLGKQKKVTCRRATPGLVNSRLPTSMKPLNSWIFYYSKLAQDILPETMYLFKYICGFVLFALIINQPSWINSVGILGTLI